MQAVRSWWKLTGLLVGLLLSAGSVLAYEQINEVMIPGQTRGFACLSEKATARYAQFEDVDISNQLTVSCIGQDRGIQGPYEATWLSSGDSRTLQCKDGTFYIDKVESHVIFLSCIQLTS